MTDQSLPQFVDDDLPVAIPLQPVRPVNRAAGDVRDVTERKLTFWTTLDKPMLIITGMLLALGLMMVYSSTFDWSLAEFGSETRVVFSHVQNVVIGVGAMMIFARTNLRFIRRIALVIMLMAISFLIAVLLFGDDTFGARRALINGRFQPSEFAELAIIIYMAAWMGSKNVRVRSLTYGLLPFLVLVGIVTGLVVIQPDLSTAVTIFITSAIMFFLAGANMRQVAIVLGVLLIAGLIVLPFFPYAKTRIDAFTAGIVDPTQASWHTQQALIAIYYGGWTGLGLGTGQSKFQGLPAPHTDSIFAVIGEEFGVIGAFAVIGLYLTFCLRGFQISRRATDAFSGLIAAGVTIWVTSKALLNIAVMTNLVPATGLPLPLISFGGSSLVVILGGIGLLHAVHRQTMIKENSPERRVARANDNRRGGDGRSRLPRTSSR
ncbi:MAG: putative lipid II flippase FtsW [Anaerolineae bacterium]|nr:putative lipid II flippase FtsW [Anaerolineae bacterium]